MLLTFVAALAACAGGAIAGLIVDVMTDKSHPKGRRLVMLLAALVVFAGVQAVAQTHSPPESDTPSQGAAPTTEPASTTPPATPTSAPTPTPAPPTTEPSPVMATSLLDLPAVDEDTSSSIDLDDPGTLEIDGTTYGRALVYQCSLYCDGPSPQVREVTLGRKFSRFTATAAVLDTSTGRHRIDITLDGHPPKTFAVAPGSPASINVSVAGVSRLRIQLYAPGKLKSPLQAGADAAGGNNGGGLPGIALGDPTLLP
ncbi:hypothetical protein [Micromonospora sp. WMMD998]|uniref:hypothetical protein n=1 Tax=Micromonospora sp. WMMD998 TaxID=3016092 RepID=UPI00249A3938|nr:hypothetical protein [Micromonospora sp. WMMD998]WFE40830.1 hypothetical protein O7619_21170 [Micromonospora sp. WMMD998]